MRNQQVLHTIIAAMFLLAPSVVQKSFAEDSPYTQSARSNSYYHFMVGSMADLRGNNREALAEYRIASQLNDQSSFLKLKVADQLLETGEPKEAGVIIEAIQTAEQKNPEYHMLRARWCSQNSESACALKALDQATHLYLSAKQTNKARETLLTKVAMLADNHKFPEALSSLEKYLKSQSDDEIVLYFVGKIYSITQNRKQAKLAFEKALDLRPSFLAASKALGLQLELEGKIKEAVQVYQTANRFTSNDEELLQKLINLSLIVDDYTAASDYLIQYLTVRPDDLQAKMRAALIFYKLKNYDRSQELFEEMVAADAPNTDRVHFYLGSLYEEKQDFPKALASYQQIKSNSEYFAESRMQMANVMIENQNQTEQAIKLLSESISLKPDSPELRMTLAATHEKAKQLPEAIRVLTDAQGIIKDNEKMTFMLGTLLDKAGDFQGGIDRMREVLRINPNNAHALNHIGYGYADKQIHLDEAEGLLKKAVQLAPDNGFILDSLGWVYFQRKDLRRAQKFLERANHLSPNQPVILEHLADTYQRVGMKQDALAMYRLIMRLSAQTAEQKKTQDELDAQNSREQMARASGEATVETEKVQSRVREKLASLGSNNPY